ncbi:hypothetical protein D1AOALGA4SA_6325 [Olavius algarvensis Delta 1 endosymbiont]|nr:hypothetical protein D1AOALGA4SA_6325 [Olavius algarvensis Delta 1 endosymbiont]
MLFSINRFIAHKIHFKEGGIKQTVKPGYDSLNRKEEK